MNNLLALQITPDPSLKGIFRRDIQWIIEKKFLKKKKLWWIGKYETTQRQNRKIIKEGLNLLDNLKRLETTYLGPSIRT